MEERLIRDFLNPGSGYGSGDGSGYGYGDGSGSGYGDGSGYGSGYGSGLKAYCGRKIYHIDGIQTMIKRVVRGFAFGEILNTDLTLTPCVVAKQGNVFAHGRTAHEAAAAVLAKSLLIEPIEKRIKAFWEGHNNTDKYPVADFSKWHHILTGSCEFGRERFKADKGLEDNDMFTVAEFVEKCKNVYGGEIIKRLGEQE